MENKIVEYVEGMSYGRGYDRLTGDPLPSRAVVGDTAQIKNAEGQRVTSSCRITTDTQTLHESLGISIDAGGSYMGFSASAKVDYANQCDFSSFSTYIIIHIGVSNAFEDITEPAFHPDAEELLRTNNTVRFRERFGDCFISGMRTGGEYFAIYQLTSTSQTKKESLAIEVQACYQGLVASADLQVKIQQARESTTDHVETQVYVYREGTIHTADITAEDIIETARQFPVKIGHGEASVYGAMIQDYKTLRSPNDAFDYYQIRAQQEALAELAKRRFEFLALRGDMTYILKHADQFMNRDGSDVDRAALSADFDTVTSQINDMVEKMSAYSRDASKADLPTYDVNQFNLPVAREEVGVPVTGEEAGVQVPSLVGLDLIVIEHALENTLRSYEEYRATLPASYVMDATQYAFIVSGVKIKWEPPPPPAKKHFGKRVWWVVAQEPAGGVKVAIGDEIKLLVRESGSVFPGPA